MYEGAQGALLDIDHGTYPYVTSSNTIASAAATGSGQGVKSINYVLGITKAYTTRVGEGPFPSEQDNDVGNELGEKGHEFGTVTGRKRRCGWFDAVLVKHAIEVSGIDGMALTKLDVLDGFEKINICTAYELDGKKLIIFHLYLKNNQELSLFLKNLMDGIQQLLELGFGMTYLQKLLNMLKELKS